MRKTSLFNGFALALILAMGALAASTVGSRAAQTTPPAAESHVASPDVYRVLAENEALRVIEATWQPGQEDAFHSHPANRITIYQTACELEVTGADGATRAGRPKAGTARIVSGKAVASHKVRNTGSKACRIWMVEMK